MYKEMGKKEGEECWGGGTEGRKGENVRKPGEYWKERERIN